MLTKAYEYCEQLTKQHATSFYQAFQLLAAEKQQAIWAIYAFCRTIDDVVDVIDAGVSPQEVAERVDAFVVAFERMLRGDPEDHPLWQALADAFARYRLQRKPFDDLIAGQRQDIVFVAPQTIAQLDAYCYAVAGTVGLMMLPVLAPDYTEDMQSPTVRIGKAMQMTNIVRDVVEDARRGRVYIPEELLQRHRCTMINGVPEVGSESGWQGVFATWVALATEHYEAGWEVVRMYPQDSQVAVRLAVKFYWEILNECVRRQGDVFTQRIFVTPEQKQRIVQDVRDVMARQGGTL